MPVTGPQIRSALASVGAVGGQIASFDQLAAGANDAMKTMGVKTVNQAAGFLATNAQESAFFRTTKEYGTGQSYAPYVGRTFEQVTWRSNYAAFGAWCRTRGLVTDGNIFVQSPAALESLTWAWLGGVWYWTINRTNWGSYSNLMEVADTGSILLISKAVNRGSPNSSGTPYGMTERTALFNAFKAMGASILPGTVTPPAPTAPDGAINGTPGQIVNAANALWSKYKGKYYGSAWPGLAELGRQPEYWCADFVRLAIRKGTGYDWAKFMSSPAYTPALVAWMVKDPMWSEISYANAKPGDIIFYLRSSGLVYHTGVVEFSQTTGANLRTIEGNTSTPGISSSMSNGGTTAKKTRPPADLPYYARVRIFRATFWQPTPTDTPVEPEEPETPEAPPTNRFGQPFGTVFTVNPISQLQVTPAFWAAHGEGHEVVSRVDAFLGDVQIGENLPLVADSSSVKVDLSSNVRRTASLVFQPDFDSPEGLELSRLLSQPGVVLAVETGVRYGNGVIDTVPVHTGRCAAPKTEWPGGRVSVESPDLMVLPAGNGFTRPVCSNPAATFVGGIAYFIQECDPYAKVVDLTGNTEHLPDVVWDDALDSRINAITQMAAAIGARVYASPVPHHYVIRPITSPGAAPMWEYAYRESLISASTTTDWSKVYNAWRVISERADAAPIVGLYEDIDPESPTCITGPFGINRNTMRTSLLLTREQCEDSAKALCDRSIGGRLNVSFTGLRNPLLEADDPIQLITDRDVYDLVLGSFTVPLGNEGVITGEARTFDLSLLTNLNGGAV